MIMQRVRILGESHLGQMKPQQPTWDNGVLISPDGEKTAWFKDSEGNILAIGSSDY